MNTTLIFITIALAITSSITVIYGNRVSSTANWYDVLWTIQVIAVATIIWLFSSPLTTKYILGAMLLMLFLLYLLRVYYNDIHPIINYIDHAIISTALLFLMSFIILLIKIM
jgi:hypothetical protein